MDGHLLEGCELLGQLWYDASKDALRVTTKASKSDYHEWLDYEFTQREKDKATVALKWEDLQIPFTITVDNANQLWVDQMRAELRQSGGFSYMNWQQAANFCAQNKFNLAEGLTWAQRAVSDPPGRAASKISRRWRRWPTSRS